MTLRTALVLGRVSNLPTVWTNVVAAAALAGGWPSLGWLVWIIGAASLFYIGGMYLNDFFDADIDAKENKRRPIPAGLAGRTTVLVCAVTMLAAALFFVWAAVRSAGPGVPFARALFAGAALAASIVAYNVHHKSNPLAPLVMGACRGLLYIVAAAAVGGTFPMGAVFAITCYVAGLTYAAGRENFNEVKNGWPLAILTVPVAHAVIQSRGDITSLIFVSLFVAWTLYSLSFLGIGRRERDVGRAVTMMIAGISLLDAAYVAASGAEVITVGDSAATPIAGDYPAATAMADDHSAATAMAVALGTPLTRLLQRFVPGT